MTNEDFNVDEAQIGRVLHFVIDKAGQPQCRPAFVVHDWPSQGKPGYVNLVVFPDGTNDGKYGTDQHDHSYSYTEGEMVIGGQSNMRSGRVGGANSSLLTRWETSVFPNHGTKAVRSWHWPRECARLQEPMAPYKAQDGLQHHNHADGVVDVHNCYACSRQAAETSQHTA